MADCEFRSLARGTPCDHCGWRLPRDYAAAPRRRCQGRLRACMHFGDLLREIVTKRGKCHHRRGVYGCAARGECVRLIPGIEGLACCEDGCSEFLAAE